MGEETGKNFTPGDFVGQLRLLEDKRLEHFLEGGQAVNIWAEVYSPECGSLWKFAPFTSRDCDVWVGHEAFKLIEEILPGKLLKASSPADGQLGVLRLSGHGGKVIDLLDGVFGLSHAEVQRAYRRSLVVGGIRILDPLFLFKGKCHNLVNLPQARRQDEKHLRILLELLPAHFERLLKCCVSGEIGERDFLSEVKTFLGFAKDQHVRKALRLVEANLGNALPLQSMACSGSERIERFAKGSSGSASGS